MVNLATAQRALDEGEARYGPLGLNLEAFARFLGEHGRAARTAAYADLALAFACGTGSAQAHAAIERHVFSQLPAALARLDRGRGRTDDVLQQLREQYFVGQKPGVLGYLGKGPLAGWFRTVATRMALGLDRTAPTAQDTERELAALSTTIDVERLQMRKEHGPIFRRAFAAAFESLSSRERAVLRLHLVEGQSIDQIAAVYEIHRATAARWVQRVRDVLLERTEDRFARDSKMSPEELDSLMRSLVSTIDLSIERLLKEG